MPDSDFPYEKLKPLARCIGNMCSYRELDGLMQACHGETIKAISFEQQAPHEIALDCLEWAQREGILRNFVAIVLRATGQELGFPAFRLVVTQLIPEALEAPYSVKPQGDTAHTVMSGLSLLNGYLGRPEIHEQLAQSRQKLTEVRQCIGRLAVYKGLHDNLHRLQIIPPRTLLQAASLVADDQISFETVQLHVDRVLETVSSAQELVSNADAIEAITDFDLTWIAEMREAATRCQEGLDKNVPSAVRSALRRIVSISDGQSSRLNKGIFNAAMELPLLHLAKTLEAAGKGDTDIESSLHPAIEAIGDLHRTLRGRVATHNRLQYAHENLTFLAGCLDNPSGEVLEDMNHLWPETRAAILAVTAYDLEPTTLPIDAQDGEKVDGGLTEVARAQSVPGFDPRTAASVKALQRALFNFQRKANAQFFDVDCKLKADFDHVFQISRGLETTLGIMQ